MARITYRKTRKGATITLTAAKGEDLRGVVEALAKPIERVHALTADTITDAQITAYFETVDRNHYSFQWCIDALQPSSPSHPHRRRNARGNLARIINRNSEAK